MGVECVGATTDQKSAWAQSNVLAQSYRASWPLYIITRVSRIIPTWHEPSNGTRCKIVEMKIRRNNERYHNNRMCACIVFDGFDIGELDGI